MRIIKEYEGKKMFKINKPIIEEGYLKISVEAKEEY